jgi:hypothetical protein
MSGSRLILLESSVRGETFFGKVNFKKADWSEPFFFFPIIRHSQNELEPEQRLYLRDYCLRELTVSTQNVLRPIVRSMERWPREFRTRLVGG